ncbi:MAG: SagB/ThcOx family dehydrogenase [Deltaproteobacteria bacterium]|nr:SagB/ThcOx family dehydrogenase [Deltaproteobacteria bacterium]
MQEKTVPVSGQITVQLPRPNFESSTSIEKALHERRSHRDYGEGPLSLEEIAQLLWAAQGISHDRDLRTSPSAGALYPVETYLVAGEVQNLPAGVYRYRPDRHDLVLVRSGDVRRQLCSASLHQDAIVSAPACIAFSAVYARSTSKYGKRGIRYTHMETGIAAQNVSLQAVSLHLGTVVIGAFHDYEVSDVLALPVREAPLLIMPVGKAPGIPSRP